jgi:dCTP deaminase
MTILARPAIIEARRANRILIEPFDQLNVGTNSYDVTLGPWFWPERPPVPTGFITGHPARMIYRDNRDDGILNPYDPAESELMWGESHEMARPLDREMPGIPAGTPVILLEPGQNMLASTIEFIGGLDDRITTMVKARSSVGRNQVTVCRCAGLGDLGFCWRYTLELSNAGTRTIALVPGRRIAQVVFFETTGLAGTHQYGDGGKYQAGRVTPGTTLAALEARWSPRDMLPRQWMDREVGLAP